MESESLSEARNYIYVLGTIFFTVYGQVILKWRIGQLGALPATLDQKIRFLLSLLLDPAIFSGFVAAFLASLCWMAAMTKFQLGHAYPFMSLNFVIVLLLSAWLLHEPLTSQKIIGVGLIVLGTIIAARG